MPIYEYRGTYNHNFGDALNQSEMEVNATYFAQIMRAQGWSDNAIAAAFGNWESECTLNPNRAQYSSYPNPRSSDGKYGGYGLPQWTEWHNKYYWWGSQYNLQFTRDNNATAGIFENQLEYHEFECSKGLHGDSSRKTWYAYNNYYIPWAQFKTSTETPEYLAAVYYWSYERSGASAVGSRDEQARKWYNFISGSSPGPGPGPGPGPQPTPTKRKSKFIIEAYAGGLFR